VDLRANARQENGGTEPRRRRDCPVIERGDDPLRYLERRAFLLALQSAAAGVESARVVLAKARQRIEGAGRGRSVG
jgi:hypothetical protein